jgi:hypothetical protein
MMYLLDTNVCVQYLRGKNLSIRDRLAACAPSDIRLYALCDSFPCSALFSANSAYSAVNRFARSLVVLTLPMLKECHFVAKNSGEHLGAQRFRGQPLANNPAIA